MLQHIRLNKKLALAVGVLFQIVLLGLPVNTFADSCTAPSTTYGSDTMSITIPTTATYTIWVRIKVPASNTNSLLLNIDGGAHCYNIGGSSSAPVNTWEWIDYSDNNTATTMQVSLSEATHTLLITGVANGTQIDRVEALAQTSCVPSGTGDNCLTPATTTTPPPSSSGGSSGGNSGGSTSKSGGSSAVATSVSSGSGSTSLGDSSISASTPSTGGGAAAITQTSTGQLQINAPITIQTTQQAGVKKVEYLLNDKLLGTEYKYPYSYKLNSRNILNGTYTLTTKTFYASGTTKTVSKKIIIKNPQSFTQFRLKARKYMLEVVLLILVLVFCILFVFRRRIVTLPFLEKKSVVSSIDEIPGTTNDVAPALPGLAPPIPPPGQTPPPTEYGQRDDSRSDDGTRQ
jgi:hypothetical protein